MELFFISAYRRIINRFRFTLIRVRIEKKQSKLLDKGNNKEELCQRMNARYGGCGQQACKK